MSMGLPKIPGNEPGLVVVAKAEKLSLAPLISDPTGGREPSFKIPDGNYGVGLYAGWGGEIELTVLNGQLDSGKIGLGGGAGGHMNLATKTITGGQLKGPVGGWKGDLEQWGDQQQSGWRVGASAAVGLGVGLVGVEASASRGREVGLNGELSRFEERKLSATWSPVLPKAQAEIKVNVIEIGYKRSKE